MKKQAVENKEGEKKIEVKKDNETKKDLVQQKSQDKPKNDKVKTTPS